MENQVGKIASALYSRIAGALSSSTKTLASTSSIKSIETCKFMKLRNGKESRGPTQTREDPPRKNMTTFVTSEMEESQPNVTTPIVEPVKENVQNEQVILKTFGMTFSPEKQLTDMPDVDMPLIFMRERPLLPFPQRTMKAKEEK